MPETRGSSARLESAEPKTPAVFLAASQIPKCERANPYDKGIGVGDEMRLSSFFAVGDKEAQRFIAVLDKCAPRSKEDYVVGDGVVMYFQFNV